MTVSTSSALRGQNQDRRVLAGQPQPQADLKAVHPRQADIEHDEVNSARLRDLECTRPVSGNPDLITLTSQSPGQRLGNRRVVLGKQYASHAPDAKANGRNSLAATHRIEGNHLVKSAPLVTMTVPRLRQLAGILQVNSFT